MSKRCTKAGLGQRTRYMRKLCVFSLLMLVFLSTGGSLEADPVYNPVDGMVPDESTAIRIAEAVWIPMYGEDHVLLEEPYMATLKGTFWEVQSVSPNAITQGTYLAQIAKSDGRIISVSHNK